MPALIQHISTLEDFVDDLRSQGRHAFSLEETKAHFELTGKALLQALFRLKQKNRIVQIRKGYYVIISPEYARQGMIPPALFIDDMMVALERSYYVGLLSASALHGASHQQPMEYFVVIERPPLRAVENNGLKINFYVKKEWDETDIVQIKTDAGYINVSTPELTALDLLYYLESTGLNRSYTIIIELVEKFKINSLLQTAKRYPQIAAIQRLGFLLDKLGEEKLAEALYRVLEGQRYYLTPLSPNKGKEGDSDNRWKIIVNTELEADL
ncbi:type IV toxin-antitoxin system AbiEi family antitoxin domain-containing protein [Parapedobacter tibetensis]|uniref:type IV toxin-antitoxin system AbiEi family antitoxin domain-containing protein n=1 Tax=Parapedobacter tibetensis TaxID=2972951 RepID=UPI00214D1699|nr:type IV toxin-antitoxin system AbiEi family antitoxin [Parapedobacter tibetensis]